VDNYEMHNEHGKAVAINHPAGIIALPLDLDSAIFYSSRRAEFIATICFDSAGSP
jgi:hypothetical protein